MQAVRSPVFRLLSVNEQASPPASAKQECCIEPSGAAAHDYHVHHARILPAEKGFPDFNASSEIVRKAASSGGREREDRRASSTREANSRPPVAKGRYAGIRP